MSRGSRADSRALRKATILLLSASLVLSSGCHETPPFAPWSDTDCGAHGTVETDEDGQRYCECADGYHQVDYWCVAHDEICGDGLCTQSEDAHSCPEDCPADCGDDLCTHDETVETCPLDCPADCGDDLCTHDETVETCPLDCPADCGDGFCTHDEDLETCVSDCARCGDLHCANETEDAHSCPDDCPSECEDGFCTHEENAFSCGEDCPPECGDGFCTHEENAVNCPAECSPPVCGDDLCTSGEDAIDCADDCPSSCGDGYCAFDELEGACRRDCRSMCGDSVCHDETAWHCPDDCDALCGDGRCTHDENHGNCATDCDVRCGDGACSEDDGESAVNCAADCDPFCGDGECTFGELGCHGDCPAHCGDGVCDSESALDCPSDCPSVCGDGACTHAEDNSSCSSDCPALANCGNGTCSDGEGESAVTCPDDCSADCTDGVITHDEECLAGTRGRCFLHCGAVGIADCSEITCTWEPCLIVITAHDSCNGQDDDCDGEVDEDEGECAVGEERECSVLGDFDVGRQVCLGDCAWSDCECVPQCRDIECGPDGCGLECGVCPENQLCDPDGFCQPRIYAFITSGTYSGNLGSLEIADLICDQEALAAGFLGRYRAILSTSERSAYDRLHFPGQVWSTNGAVAEMLSNSKEQLFRFDSHGFESPLEQGIIHTAGGSERAGVPVWTGSNVDGSSNAEGRDCDEWTSSEASDLGMAGLSNRADATWIQDAARSCDSFAHLYCIRTE